VQAYGPTLLVVKNVEKLEKSKFNRRSYLGELYGDNFKSVRTL
jgi:hypothetical protein